MKASECNVDVENLEVHAQKAPETKVVRKLLIDPPVVLLCHSKLRRWAAQNALTLLFVNIYFVITWVVIILAARFG